MELLQSLVEQDYGYEAGTGRWGRSKKHDSLVINEDKQTWFWNSMGLRGNVLDYLIKVRGMSFKSAKKYLKEVGYVVSNSVYNSVGIENDIEQPPYEKLVELFHVGGADNREYWYNRCLTDKTIDRFKLGFFDGWYLIPLFDDDGRFVNFQCRREFPEKRIKQWYKHTKPILFNSEILQFVSTIYITEGTVDAILLNQLGFPAISQNGTNIWMQEWFEKFMNVKNIIYIEDNDKAGRIASKLVSRSLGLERVKILSYNDMPDKYDTVDFFRNGGSIDDFRNLIESSTKYIYELE